MKSKQLIYVLAFSVLAIWGIIIFRIFLSIRGTDNIEHAIVAKLIHKADVPKLFPRTAKTQSDYPDPFNLDSASLKPDSTIKEAIKSIIKSPEMNESKPLVVLKYIGYIREGKGKVSVAIISHNEAQRMMRTGDTLAGFTLIGITKELIRMSNKGKTKIFKAE